MVTPLASETRQQFSTTSSSLSRAHNLQHEVLYEGVNIAKGISCCLNKRDLVILVFEFKLQEPIERLESNLIVASPR